jgi:hypothetical protein
MLKRHVIAIVVTAILAITAVIYMYSKNYITFGSEIRISFAQDSNDMDSEKVFTPNVVPEIVDTNLVSKIQPISPQTKSNKFVKEARFFDDVMKVIETFIPLATVLIPIYLHQKNKKRVKASEA